MTTRKKIPLTPFVLALGYALFDWLLLPEAPRHLAYCISAETGLWAPTEFAHPAYVPLLGLLGGTLKLFGLDGRLLLPAQLLNVAAAAAATALMYSIARRFTEDRLLSLSCALLFGLSKGFWLQHARPMPYSLAALLIVLALWLLLGKRTPSDRSCAAQGLAVAGSSLFTIASLSAVPVFAYALWRGRGRGSRGRRGALIFLGTAAAVFAAGFAVFLVYHGIDLSALSARSLFFEVEQVRGSSIWTSGSLLRQASGMLASLRMNIDPQILFVTALVLAVSRPGLKKRGTDPELLDLVVAAGGTAFTFALFFFLNNTQNGFILIAAVYLPIIAYLARGSAGLRACLAACAVALVLQTAVEARAGRRLVLGPGISETEPAFLEGRFLRRSAGDSDVVLAPNRPERGFDYYFGINFVELSDARVSRSTPLPLRLDEHLERRIDAYLAAGKTVLFAQWVSCRVEPGATEMFHHDLGAEAQARRVASIRSYLERRYRLGRPMRSPSGHSYVRLFAKKTPGAIRTPGRGPSWPEDWPDSADELKRFKKILRADPSDAYAYCDLAALFWERGSSRLAEESLKRASAADPGVEAYVRKMRSLRLARELSDRGVKRFLAGDPKAALSDFDRALKENPAFGEALMSRSAVRSDLGDIRGALDDLDVLMGLAPTDAGMRASIYSARAGLLEGQGRLGEAVVELRRALEEAPWNWPGRPQAREMLKRMTAARGRTR